MGKSGAGKKLKKGTSKNVLIGRADITHQGETREEVARKRMLNKHGRCVNRALHDNGVRMHERHRMARQQEKDDEEKEDDEVKGSGGFRVG